MSGLINSAGSRSGVIGRPETERIGFSAHGATEAGLGTGSLNLTGGWDTIAFTQIWDIGGCYTTNTFTAPVDGKYFFSARVHVQSLTVGDDMYMRFVGGVSDRTYYTQQGVDYKDSAHSAVAMSIIANMDANDTMFVAILNGSAARGVLQGDDNTGFHGWLLGY